MQCISCFVSTYFAVFKACLTASHDRSLILIFRMFVDALDAQMYEEHHRSGLCYLNLSKVSGIMISILLSFSFIRLSS